MGKWAAKIRVETKLIPEVKIKQESGDYTCQHPLNPIDLPSSTRLLLYNRIVMPPVSLLSQAQLSGDYWKINQPLEREVSAKGRVREELPNPICLPSGIAYGANYAPALC